AMIFPYAFATAGNETTTFRFYGLDNFSRFLTDTVFLYVLKRSLLIAVVTTVVCALLQATPSPIRLPRNLQRSLASSGLCADHSADMD
ncbi:MAG: hypothetical protein V8Q32_04970, partial [Anaerotignum faecicola]